VPFAIVDTEREGIWAVLMIVDEQTDADFIATELRRAKIGVDIRPADHDALPR
jgi:hypothetical protein